MRMGTPLARINLNLPSEARARLRGLAKHLNVTEGEFARSLLLEALDRAERMAFRRKLQEAHTDDVRKREREIAGAMERLRGAAR
jgi:hypothetical protein